MSNFPEGPWEAHELSGEDHRGMGWIRANDQDIAAYGDRELWMEENRAIGKLLAAAPSLLKELENIANADTREWDESVRSQFQEWAKSRARYAIDKATK